MNEERWPAAALAAAGLLFVLLATVNSAGYRYGVSDQAFQVPAVIRAIDPSTFPRDTLVLDAQARLMVIDDAVGALVRATGLSLEAVFLAGYLLTAALLWAGILLIGRYQLRSPLATVLLGAAVTLRHRIPRTSANSIEPYFYPRTLAFSLGIIAVAMVLRRRYGPTLLLVALSTLVHVTTGAWFAVLTGVAVVSMSGALHRPIFRGLRPLIFVGIAATVAAAGWLAMSARIQPLIAPIDAAWLEVISTKDSLFPNEWPVWAWLANGALPAVLLMIHYWRGRLGTRTAEDEALVHGTMALTLVFVVSVPFVALHWTLPTQLQISRVFWLIDFVTLMYGVALVTDLSRRHYRLALRVATAAVLAVSVARGGFVMLVEHPERRVFEVSLPASEWTAAMQWLASRPAGVHVLADPGHALLYGSSVRVAAQRDVVLEDSKDTALALYSRELALRVGDRRASLADYGQLSSERAAALSRRYDVDYLVTAGAPLSFPVAYSNTTFRIYDMRAARRETGRPLAGVGAETAAIAGNP